MATSHNAGSLPPREEIHVEYIDEKDGRDSATPPESQEGEQPRRGRLQTARDLVAEVLDLDDDPSENPWTFRMWFLGLGVSCFGGIVTTINTFKPQALSIHIVFVAVIAYVLGVFMASVIPSRGKIGRMLNPGPFNTKEHCAICIMVAASAATPEAMQILAVQKLWYDINPHPAVSIILILSTHMLGYGIAGLLRQSLVYPSAMLYPNTLPNAVLLQSLHRDKASTKERMRVFYYAFFALFIWQSFPQYIMPLMSGVSFICLGIRNSLMVTNIFGGSMANEGLGLLSLSLDWNQITAFGNPLWIPFQALANTFVGYIIGIVIFISVYYSNSFQAKKFPFLSTMLFSHSSSDGKFVSYNQTAILNGNFQVDEAKLAEHGVPWLTATNAVGSAIQNMSITAVFTHMLLWHWDDIKVSLHVLAPLRKILKPKEWSFPRFSKAKPANRTPPEEADAICPHYRVMQNYDDVPTWWFGVLWVASAVLGLVMSRLAKSTLEVWAYFIAIIVPAISLPFTGVLYAMYGVPVNVQPLIQMIGAYLLPGRPLANLYFAGFGYDSLYQGKVMLRDLKLGHYVHLAPKCTFAVQIIGTVVGCLMSYIMMQQITTEKRDILMSIQGTNIWSGQKLQTHNSAAVSWGGLAKYMYSVGTTYQWVSLGFLLGFALPLPFWLVHSFVPGAKRLRLDYWNVTIILGYTQLLSHGVTSGYTLHFLAGLLSQFYLRVYRTNWFVKYNYLMSAGLDGGTQLVTFILTFAVMGAGGIAVDFPKYFGNYYHSGNYDYCMKNPALGKGDGKRGKGH